MSARTIFAGYEGLGYRIATATSGPEALELFLAEPQDFDLLVTDQTMPKMTGQSLIHRIRRLRPDFPAILVTGFTHVTSGIELQALGVVDLLTKPLTKTDLGEAVRSALDRRGK